MHIEIGTDRHVVATDELRTLVAASVSHALARFAPALTRVVVHLADENGEKGGDTDVRCTIEARPEGRQPVAATHRAARVALAVDGAARKLARTLGRARDRAVHRKGGPSLGERLT
jgi:ribosome-associated translation inhibitor RaiA